MQHRKIITSALALAVLIPVLSVYSHGEASDNASKRASTSERVGELRAEREERRASSTESRAELHGDIAQRKVENTVRVFRAMVGRFDRIIERIESRIEKFEARGADVTEAESFVVEAQDNLALAVEAIDALEAFVPDLTGDGIQANFEEIRDLAKEVKAHFREVHRSLMNAVRSLRSGVENDDSSETEESDE